MLVTTLFLYCPSKLNIYVLPNAKFLRYWLAIRNKTYFLPFLQKHYTTKKDNQEGLKVLLDIKNRIKSEDIYKEKKIEVEVNDIDSDQKT